jgi:hypothetical protein
MSGVEEGSALDPLAELVIANAWVGGAPLPSAWAIQRAAQRPDGSIPPVRDLRGDRFDDVYHSTLVVALAGAVEAATRAARRQAPAFAHYAD